MRPADPASGATERGRPAIQGALLLEFEEGAQFALPVDSNSLNLSPYIEYSKAEIPLRLAPCLVIAGAGLATGGGTH